MIWESYKQRLITEDISDLQDKLSQNPRFMDWFGKSQVKVGNKPLIMFHGTPANYEHFSDDYAGIGNMQYGVGHYFTSNPSVASSYASKVGNNQIGGNVRPVVLKIEIPIEAEGEFKINKTKMIRLIKMSPILDEQLKNWGC